MTRVGKGDDVVGVGLDRAAPAAPAAPAPKAGRGEDPLAQKNLMREIEGLALGHPDRVFGTEKGARAAEYLADRLRDLGFKPVDGSYFQPFEVEDEKKGKKKEGQNVVGLLRGTDPRLADEVVMISAHYDSQKGTYEGANDNASGVGAILAIGAALAKDPPKRSVLIVSFDGEEVGRLGSRHYAREPVWPLEKTALMVNLDMIGQVHLETGTRQDVYQWASADPFARSVLARAADRTQVGRAVDGYPEQQPEAQFFTTDAEPLYRLGVPVVNFLSGRDLENHRKTDKMDRVIPERAEQYTRLAHAVCEIGANEPVAVRDVIDRAPGGLSPLYPMVRARRDASLAVPYEEDMRLYGLYGRLFDFCRAARAVYKQAFGKELADVKGDSIVGEADLHDLRTRRADLCKQYRDIPKADVAARKPLLEKMRVLAAADDVMSAFLYLNRLDKKQSYYMQRIPERLFELSRGAKRLGLSHLLDGVVRPSDVKRFSGVACSDRVVYMARETLAPVLWSLRLSARALVDPEGARDERALDQKDRDAFSDTVAKLLRDEPLSPAAGRAQLAASFCEQTLTGLGTAGPKWLKRFADQNTFADFEGLAADLGLDGAEADKLKALGAAVRTADAQNRGEAVVAFYDALAQLALGGGRIDSLEAVAQLEGSAASLAQRVRGGASKGGQALARLEKLVDAVLPLAGLVDPWAKLVRSDVPLVRVDAGLRAVAEALEGVPGAAGVRDEVVGWLGWLQPFLEHEPKARQQAKTRVELSKRGYEALLSIEKAFVKRLPDDLGPDAYKSLKAAAFQLSGRSFDKWRDDDDKEYCGRLARHADALSAAFGFVSNLGSTPAYDEIGRLRDVLYVPGAAKEDLAKIREVIAGLEALEKTADAQMERGPRNGPMGLVGVRLLQQQDE